MTKDRITLDYRMTDFEAMGSRWATMMYSGPLQWILLPVLLMYLTLTVYGLDDRSDQLFLIVFMLGLALLVIGLLVLLARSDKSKIPGRRVPIRFTADSHGLSWGYDALQLSSGWGGVLAIQQTRKYVVVTLANAAMIAVPRRVLDPARMQQLRQWHSAMRDTSATASSEVTSEVDPVSNDERIVTLRVSPLPALNPMHEGLRAIGSILPVPLLWLTVQLKDLRRATSVADAVPLLVTPATFLLISVAATLAQRRMRRRQHSDAGRVRSVSVDQHGLTLTTRDGRSVTAWSDVVRVKESREQLEFWTRMEQSPVSKADIPEDALVRLRTLLTTHLEKRFARG